MKGLAGEARRRHVADPGGGRDISTRITVLREFTSPLQSLSHSDGSHQPAVFLLPSEVRYLAWYTQMIITVFHNKKECRSARFSVNRCQEKASNVNVDEFYRN